VNVTVTFELFQPAAFEAGDAEALIVGGVLSRLIVTDAEAVFPAMSAAVPEITWLRPSALTVAGGVQLPMPDSESLHVNVTVTFELFQPFPFGVGEDAVEIVGGVLSIFNLMLVLAVFPALSVAVPEMT